VLHRYLCLFMYTKNRRIASLFAEKIIQITIRHNNILLFDVITYYSVLSSYPAKSFRCCTNAIPSVMLHANSNNISILDSEGTNEYYCIDFTTMYVSIIFVSKYTCLVKIMLRSLSTLTMVSCFKIFSFW